jgi:hypothetical protein
MKKIVDVGNDVDEMLFKYEKSVNLFKKKYM